MSRFFLCAAILLLFSCTLLAQNNASILVQSPDGRTVKLMWLVKHWNPGMKGFDIKRMQALGKWEKLNPEPIVPGIKAKKSIFAVDADKLEASRIKDKLYDLLKDHKIAETDSNFLYELEVDPEALQDMMRRCSRDYDMAMICGFAYTDHTVTSKTEYQYGLFEAGTDLLVASVGWNYGQIPDLDMVRDITSKATISKKGVQLVWNADAAKMRAADVAGFNIYREGIRLNDTPIVVPAGADMPEISWYSRTADASVQHQYGISAETIFGIEGVIRPYRFNPDEHPREYKKAEVTDVNSLGYYFKEGIAIKWSFPKEYQAFIKGFYVEKDNMPEGYKKVSPLLDANSRDYTDATASPVTDYIRFRIVAVYNDRSQVPGRDRVYSYFPVHEPPKPMNIKGVVAAEGKNYVAHLSWDQPMAGDEMTDHYRVYTWDVTNSRLAPAGENVPAKNGTFRYVLPAGSAATYRFCIVAATKGGTESHISDTIYLAVPSAILPKPSLGRIIPGNMATAADVEWIYPQVSDLKGFRIFRDGQLVASEAEVHAGMRHLTIPLDPDATYMFTIQAIAENGVESEISAAVQVAMPKAHK